MKFQICFYALFFLFLSCGGGSGAGEDSASTDTTAASDTTEVSSPIGGVASGDSITLARPDTLLTFISGNELLIYTLGAGTERPDCKDQAPSKLLKSKFNRIEVELVGKHIAHEFFQMKYQELASCFKEKKDTLKLVSYYDRADTVLPFITAFHPNRIVRDLPYKFRVRVFDHSADTLLAKFPKSKDKVFEEGKMSSLAITITVRDTLRFAYKTSISPIARRQ